MAKKKSRPGKKAPKRSSRPSPKGEAPLELPDRRAIEGVMHGFLGSLQGDREETALDKAQALVYKAFDAAPKDRALLARRALEISPDCADAYVLLAEATKHRKEALEFYEQAVAAGERALGPEVFQNAVGHFWGLLETRPYMRAREGLANVLWTLGRRDDAIGHLKDMLRLNPGDNQGNRYLLAGWLLAEGRDEELDRLLNQYDESTAYWTYTKALAVFRKSGDSPEARTLLEVARKSNKHVPDYLLGRKMLPMEQPGSYSLGSEEEAILYGGTFLSGWKATPGATAWLNGTEPRPKGKSSARRPETGPLPAVKKRLARLPQKSAVWQADFRPFGPRVEEAGELIQPWLLLIAGVSEGLMIGQALATGPPSANWLWDALAQALQKPLMGKSHRPAELQVRPDEKWDELKPHFEEIGIDLVPSEGLGPLDFLYEKLGEELCNKQPPGLLEMPGVTPDHLAGFYQAAAQFYRRAPWRKLGYESAIRVATDKFQSGPWYAIVMGQSGMTFGVALYDDMKVLKKLWSGRMSQEENARETVALTVTFDKPADVPDADLDAIEEYQFEIAGPEAYPSIFKKERGMSMRPPLAWEIELMEGCLRALPKFVARHRPDDVAPHEISVETADGPLALTLSWIED